MKTIIITGANGFVGSWLCRTFVNNGYEVVGIVRNRNSDISKIKNIENLKIVVSEISELKNHLDELPFNASAFIHVAWHGAGGKLRADYKIQLSNVDMLLDAAMLSVQVRSKRFLTTGTISERIAENIRSNQSTSDNIIYGIAKNTAHEMLHILASKHKFEYSWLTLANLFGPNSINGNIIQYTLAELIKGNVPRFSSGEQYYDLLYIEDLALAVMEIVKCEKMAPHYYIGSGKPQKLKNFLVKAASICNPDIKIELGYYPDDGIDYDIDWYDISKLIETTDYKPQFKYKEGIIKTLSWMKETGNAI